MKNKITGLKSQPLEYVKYNIGRGKLKNALAALDGIALEKRDDILLLNCRLVYLEDCAALGILPYEFVLLERQKIAYSVIHICHQIEESER